MTASKSTTQEGRPQVQSDRIPKELQEVFIAAGQGKEIHKPPSCGSKIFKRFFRVPGSGNDGKKKVKRIASFRMTSKLYSIASTTSDDTHDGSEAFSNVSTRTLEVEPLSVQSEVTFPKTPPPQAVLKSELWKRGYGSSMEEFSSLSTAYYNQPTKLQVASYGVRLIDSARNGDTDKLRALLHAGLSPNACNPQGESIVHDVCRRGQVDSLRVLMEFGCDVRIADSNGRTPMHSACWAAHSNFDMVELLMQVDLNLFFISDTSGKLPLSYVQKDREPAWLDFLKSKMDQYWPTCDDMETENNKSDDGAAPAPAPPSIASQQPGTRPVVDPTNALPIQLASMVADGRIEPDEAEFLKYDSIESQEESDWDSDGASGSGQGRKASQDSIRSFRSFNEASLADILGNLDFSSEQVDWD